MGALQWLSQCLQSRCRPNHAARASGEKFPDSSFGKLPVELVQGIASHLPVQDLCTFRLACKGVYESTLYIYRCEIFGETQSLQTDLSLGSMKRIETIASNPGLAPHVHSLTVKFVDDFDNKLGDGLVWNRHTSGYLKSDADVQKWGEILRGLVNCTSFHLIRHGWSDKDTCLDQFTSTDIIALVLTSIINENMTVREFLVDFIPPAAGGVNELDLRRLNIDDLLRRPEFIAIWAKVEVLLFNFIMSDTQMIDWIDPMVRHANGLRELTMMFDNGSVSDKIFNHLSSLETPARLQKLSLGCITGSARGPKDLNAESLSNLLQKHHDSLRVLNIKSFRLDIPGWKPIIEMLSEFPLLEGISFCVLREGHRSRIHFPVASEIPEFDGATHFTCLTRTRRSRTASGNLAKVNIAVTCRGPNTRAIIKQLAESMDVI